MMAMKPGLVLTLTLAACDEDGVSPGESTVYAEARFFSTVPVTDQTRSPSGSYLCSMHRQLSAGLPLFPQTP